MDRQNRGVCFEDIYIESPDDSAVDPRAWGPFVMRELPALLLWRFELDAVQDWSADFAERVDLLVIDGSCGSRSAAEFAATVNAALCPVADLAWERLGALRVAAARLLDLAATGAEHIVSIEACSAEPWSAALMVGWVASRLRWSAPDAPDWIRPDGSAGTAAWGQSTYPSLSLRFADGETAAVAFTGPRDAALSLSGRGSTTMLFPAMDDGEALARLIDAPVADPLYSAAVAALAGERPASHERTLAECW
jgi:hypothetical protein